MTVEELKQRFINYLGSMDMNKMNIMDLNVYVNILRMVNDMDKPDPSAALMDFYKQLHKDSEQMTFPVAAPDFSVKEASDNG